MKFSPYRMRYRPIIAAILRELADRPKSEQNAALRDAFPDGIRKYHPYKMWLKEIREQRGLYRDKRFKKGEKLHVEPMKGQRDLFAEEAAS